MKMMVSSLLKLLSAIIVRQPVSSRVSCIHWHWKSTVTDHTNMDKRDYWEHFYKTRGQAGQDSFDWLARYPTIMEQLTPIMHKKTIRLLDLGCGTSHFTLKLLEDSVTPVQATCVDFSETAVAQQNKNYTSLRHPPRNKYSSIAFLTADATALPFLNNVFDVIIDKGTTDAVFKEAENGKTLAQMIYWEALRVVTPGGYVVQITDEDPELRVPLLEKFGDTNTHVWFKSIEESGYPYFMYFIKKKEAVD